MSQGHPTERTRIHREPERGVYDKGAIHSILDEALVGHVGFIADGSPFVIPMLVARMGDELLLHGSTASRLMRNLGKGSEVCVTVTHIDGLVAARSVFNSSMNYRSVVVLGRARLIDDADDKREALRALVEHLLPGRWDEARLPTPKEMKATSILAVPIDEASAKVRTGPPIDEDEDYELDIWAGVVPLAMTASDPEPDPVLRAGIPLPDSVKRFSQ